MSQPSALSLNFSLFGASHDFISRNKDILWLLFISFILCCLLLAIAVISAIPLIVTHNYKALTIGGLIFTFVISYTAYFFHAATIYTIIQRLRGNNLTIGAALKNNLRIPFHLMLWCIINSIIGTLCNILENAHNLFEEIIGFLLSASWGLCSLFVLPLMVTERTYPLKAIKQSTKLQLDFFRNRFNGQKMRRRGRITSLLMFIFIIVLVSLAFAAFYAGLFALFIAATAAHQITAAALIAALIIGFSLYANLFGATINAGLFIYLHDHIAPAGFPESLLGYCFTPKKSGSGLNS